MQRHTVAASALTAGLPWRRSVRRCAQEATLRSLLIAASLLAFWVISSSVMRSPVVKRRVLASSLIFSSCAFLFFSAGDRSFSACSSRRLATLNSSAAALVSALGLALAFFLSQRERTRPLPLPETPGLAEAAGAAADSGGSSFMMLAPQQLHINHPFFCTWQRFSSKPELAMGAKAGGGTVQKKVVGGTL